MTDEQKYLGHLRKILVERFNVEELRTLCSDLGLDYAGLPGDGKSDKAREMIDHFERRGQINKLLQTGRALRPDIDWKDISRLQNDILLTLPNSGLRSTEIRFTVCSGDITDFEADVIALKYAQHFYGVDSKVAFALDVGKDVVNALQTIGSHKIFHSVGKIKPPQVLFMSVPPLYEFNYGEIRKFSKDILTVLADEMPSAQHLAMTVHGLGYGLDETESLRAQLAGFLDAFDVKSYPVNLKKITIVERDPDLAKRLSSILENAIPDSFVVIPGEQAFHLSYIKRSSLTTNVGKESSAKPHILVLTSTSKESEDVYYYGIQNPINEAGYLCERVNITEATKSDFLNHIRSRIETSAFVLADLTFPSPNFYLLLGYAWGRNRPIILAMQDSTDLQFEAKEHQCIVYERIRDLEQALKIRLGTLNDQNPAKHSF